MAIIGPDGTWDETTENWHDPAWVAALRAEIEAEVAAEETGEHHEFLAADPAHRDDEWHGALALIGFEPHPAGSA